MSRSSRILSLVKIPVSLGQPFLGLDQAPRLLLEAGLLQLLADSGWRVKQLPSIGETEHGRSKESSDTGNNRSDDEEAKFNAKNCFEVGTVCQSVYGKVRAEASTDNFLLILGGDHCIPIGTIPAIIDERPSTGIVWVDAHADINTPASSGSGNMHGMPLAFLLGLVPEAKAYPAMSWFKPVLVPKDIVYIGLRDLDAPEKETIKRLGIKYFTMHDIDRHGIGKVMDETISYFKDKKGIHLSFDIDALDPFFAPSTGTAVRGGLTFREGNYICEALAETGKLHSTELVEVNPSLHSDLDAKTTIDMAMSLIGSAVGRTII
jgi:arginase